MSIKIIYTATLTEEEVEILAQVKGYNPKISNIGEDGIVETDNPVSKADFIADVFKAMIVNDATSVFSNSLRTTMADQLRVQEEAIRESVQSSITSTIK